MSSLRSRCMKVLLAISLGRWRCSVCSFWKSWEVLVSRQWMAPWRNWTGSGKRWCIPCMTICNSCSRFCCVNVPCSFSLQNQDLVDQYLSVILGLEPNQSYAAMLGLVVQFCTAQKEIDIVKRYKVNLLYCFFGGISSITSHHVEGGWRDVSVRCWYFASAPGFIIWQFSGHALLTKTAYRGGARYVAFCCGKCIYVDTQHCSFLPSPLL